MIKIKNDRDERDSKGKTRIMGERNKDGLMVSQYFCQFKIRKLMKLKRIVSNILTTSEQVMKFDRFDVY